MNPLSTRDMMIEISAHTMGFQNAQVNALMYCEKIQLAKEWNAADGEV
jgi:hypothetical protein